MLDSSTTEREDTLLDEEEAYVRLNVFASANCLIAQSSRNLIDSKFGLSSLSPSSDNL